MILLTPLFQGHNSKHRIMTGPIYSLVAKLVGYLYYNYAEESICSLFQSVGRMSPHKAP